MPKRLLASFLSALLGLLGPGLSGYAYANEKVVLGYDDKEQRVVPVRVHVATKDIVQRLRASQALQRRATPEQIDQAVKLIERYQSSFETDEDSAEALKGVVDELAKAEEDPNLSLAKLFDRLSTAARQADGSGMTFDVLDRSKDGKSSVMAVRSAAAGRTAFIQKQRELAPNVFRRVITRPHPKTGVEEVDVVYDQIEQDAAVKQRIRYNRRVVMMFENMEKMFWKQGALSRRLQKNCDSNGNARADRADEAVTNTICARLKAYFDEQQRLFDQETYSEKYKQNLRDYIKKIKDHKARNALEELDWQELEVMQRLALRFYNRYQLDMMQKMVIIQLSSYFQQITNVDAKQSKDEAALDAQVKTHDELQKVLSEYEKGNLQGYSAIMRAAGWVELKTDDPRYIDPELLAYASEAFAAVSYAVDARGRLMETSQGIRKDKTVDEKKRDLAGGEEFDSALEEANSWLKIAQLQLQSFELGALRIQMERLRDGKLRQGIGVDKDDKDGMKSRINILLKEGEGYKKSLEQATIDTKELLIKQAVSSWWLAFNNARFSYYFDETMQQRLRVLHAKVGQIKQLYLALQFEKHKHKYKDPADQVRDKVVEGAVYQRYLANKPPEVQALVGELERFVEKLAPLLNLQSVEAIRPKLEELEGEFKALAEKLLEGKPIPNVEEITKRSQALGVGHGKLLAAAQNFASQLRIFDMVNELDLYLIQYASSKSTNSEGEGTFNKVMKKIEGFLSWITGGYRDKAIDKALEYNPLTSEAWLKLSKQEGKRKEVLRQLALGNFHGFKTDDGGNAIGQDDPRFKGAIKLIEEIDPEAAAKAWAEYLEDKADDDPYEELDFDSFVGKAPENPGFVKAQGVVMELFKHMQTYILGYTVAAAVVDTVIMSVLTAGFAQIGGYALQGAKAIAVASRVAQVMRAIAQTQKIQTMIRAMNALGKLPVIGLLVRVPQFAYKTVGVWGGNIKNTFKVVPLKMTWSAPWQFVKNMGGAIKSSLAFHVHMALVMGGASAGISATQHYFAGESSQFKGYDDALLQGAAGGAGFGGRTAFLMLLTPFPATAFGTGRLGTMMKGVANMPGPISALASGAAKLTMKTTGATGAIAEAGWIGATQGSKVMMASHPIANMIAGGLVWMGAMIDGAAKFYLFAMGSQELAQTGHYLLNKKRGSYQNEDGSPIAAEHGETAEVQALTESFIFSQHVMEVSWLLMPQNPMARGADQKQQSEAVDAFRYKVREPGGAQELYNKQVGADFSYVKPWYMRTLGEIVRGEKVKTGKVTEDMRNKAERFIAPERGTAELFGYSVQNPETSHGRVLRMDKVLENLGKETPKESPQTQPQPPPVGEGLFGKPTSDGVYIGDLPAGQQGGKGKAQAPKQLLITDSRGNVIETRNIEGATPAATSAKKGSGLVDMHGRPLGETTGKAPALLDASGRPMTPSEKPVDPAAARVVDAKGETIDADVVKAGEFRFTIEGLEVNRLELVNKLKNDGGLRSNILAAGDSFTFKAETVKLKGGGTRSVPEVTVRGEALKKLKEAAQLAHVETMWSWPSALSSPWMLAKRVSGRAHDILFQRPLDNRYQMLVKEAAEGVRAGQPKEIIDAVRGKVQKMIDARKGTDKAALEGLRPTLEGDAYILVGERLELAQNPRNWGWTKWTWKMLTSSGKSRKAQREEAIDRLLDIWEMGKMAQLRGPDGKAIIDPATGLPMVEAGREFKDQGGSTIPGFRPAQKSILREVLLNDAKYDLQFAQMPTGGGKTLTSMVMAERMHVSSLARGKKGAVYLTTNVELVAQAKADYMAFNKGREPPFKIMTYEDFMAMLTESKASGAPSPLAEYDIICDEFDKLAMGTPLSLGAFNGQLSFAKIDPMQMGMRAGLVPLEGVATPAMREFVVRVLGEPARNQAISPIEALYAKYGSKGPLNENTFHEMYKNPQFKSEFNSLIDLVYKETMAGRRTAASREFRDAIDLSKYPEFTKRFPDPAEARAQIQRALLREHREALGTITEAGVIERQHGNLKNWIKKIYEGAYQLESQPEKSKVTMKHPTRDQVLQLHNDTPYESLDTSWRSASELKESVPLTLDFETVAITNFRELIKHAKVNGAKVFATSGTCADVIRKVLIENFGFKFSGELTIPRPLEYRSLSAEASPYKTVVDEALANRAEMAKIGKKGTTYTWVESEGKLAELLKVAEANGIPKERISLRVYPTSNMKEKQLWLESVPQERNMDAFHAGEVDLVILVGSGGFRGLNNKHTVFKGGKIKMFVIDPHTLPVDELTQLIGRTAPGRTEGVQTEYYGLVKLDGVMKHHFYNRSLSALLEKVDAAAARADLASWKSLVEQIKDAPAPQTGFDKIKSNPKLINERIFIEEILAVGRRNGGLSETQAVQLYEKLKDPNNLEGTGWYQESLAAYKIREALGDRVGTIKTREQIEAALRDPVSRQRLIEVLQAEMQGQAQIEAIGSSGILDEAPQPARQRARPPVLPGGVPATGVGPLAPVGAVPGN